MTVHLRLSVRSSASYPASPHVMGRHLCHVVESKGALALNVIISGILKGVVCADQNLCLRIRASLSFSFQKSKVLHLLTLMLLPGSLTVVNCSSLYFLNAGFADSRRLRSSGVKAFISACCESMNCNLISSGRLYR